MTKTTPMREELGVKKERFIQITVAVLVVAIALLLWGMVDRAEASQRSSTLIQISEDGSDGARYELKSEDGELTILEDGEPMPEDRIIRKGKTLILLNEEGRAVFQALIGEDGEIEFSQNIGGNMFIPRVPRVPRALYGAQPPRAPRSPSMHVGISAGRVDGALADQLGLEQGQGILVNRVFSDSPASKSGLKKHDIITEVDGESVSSVNDLRDRLGEMEEGETLTLSVLRGGQSQKVEITPEMRESRAVVYFGDASEVGDLTGPSVYSFDSGGDWSVQMKELQEFPGSVQFFGDDGGVAVYAPHSDLEKDLAQREADLKEREAQLEEMEARLKRLEALLEELVEKERR